MANYHGSGFDVWIGEAKYNQSFVILADHLIFIAETQNSQQKQLDRQLEFGSEINSW